MAWTLENFIPRRPGETVGHVTAIFGAGTPDEFRYWGSYNQGISSTLVDMLTEAEKARQAAAAPPEQPDAIASVLSAFNAGLQE